MRDIIILLLEQFVSPENNVIYYQYLWENNSWVFGYGLSSFVLPAIIILIFYKFIDPPLAQLWHWVIALISASIIAFLFGYLSLYNFFEGLNGYGCIVEPGDCGFPDGQSPEDNFFMSGLLAGTIAFFIGIILSLGLKYLSVNNTKNPF